MANTLAAVAPRLLAQGLVALRQFAMLPQLVNRKYDDLAGQLGSQIDVPIPSAIAVQVVAPNNIAPATGDISPSVVSVPLNNWFEAPFYLTDQDLMIAMDGTIPMEASEAIKSLANRVNSDILLAYKDFYGYQGTAGATPIASTTADITNVRKTLNRQLAPIDDRRFLLDPDAEGNALNLTAFQAYYSSNDDKVIKQGNLGTKLGFDFYMSQLIPTHSAGSLGTGTLTINGNQAAGTSNQGESTSSVNMTITGGTGLTLNYGDILTIAGDNQTYVVTATVTATASSNFTVVLAPQLQLAHLNGDAVTLKASHVVNLAFHRDAIAFATRPLQEAADGLGHIIETASDPLSGLTLRLEISREFKRTRYSYDILYGVKTVRRELGCRLAG